MRIQAVHTVPVWNDHGTIHIAGIDEERPDLEDHVVGWCNRAVIDLEGELRTFILIYRREDVS